MSVRFVLEKNYLPDIERRFLRGASTAVGLVAREFLEMAVLRMYRTKPRGIRYRFVKVIDQYGRERTFKNHHASAPGQAPAILTGWLANSSFSKKENDFRWEIGFNAPHAVRVHEMDRKVLSQIFDREHRRHFMLVLRNALWWL